MLPLMSMGCNQEVTPTPVWVPTQWPLALNFASRPRLDQNFSPCSCIVSCQSCKQHAFETRDLQVQTWVRSVDFLRALSKKCKSNALNSSFIFLQVVSTFKPVYVTITSKCTIHYKVVLLGTCYILGFSLYSNLHSFYEHKLSNTITFAASYIARSKNTLLINYICAFNLYVEENKKKSLSALNLCKR